jgi:hypothetical protein
MLAATLADRLLPVKLFLQKVWPPGQEVTKKTVDSSRQRTYVFHIRLSMETKPMKMINRLKNYFNSGRFFFSFKSVHPVG